MRRFGKVFAAAALAAGWAPAHAAILDFNGTVTARGVVTPDAACAPRNRGNIDPSTSSGTSNLGAFTFGHSVCTSGPPGGPIDGTFAIDFGSDGFFGALTGASSQNATTPTFFDFNIAYTILGGTGRFLGATGSFATGAGSGADTTVRPSRITLNFVDGAINAPAVPEPETWLLLILGFGLVGGTLRRQKARLVPA
jgi:hypothetical protein